MISLVVSVYALGQNIVLIILVCFVDIYVETSC